MTVEELLARESIRHTLASYHLAGDRLKIDDFVAVFTEDGILEMKDSFRYVGHSGIRGWLTGWRDSSQAGKPVHKSKFIRHHLTTCHIEITGSETAKTRSYFAAYLDHGVDHCGVYVDAFRKVGDRWLIAHREVRMDWRSADTRPAPQG